MGRFLKHTKQNKTFVDTGVTSQVHGQASITHKTYIQLDKLHVSSAFLIIHFFPQVSIFMYLPMYIILHTFITIPTDNIPVQLSPSYYSSALPFTSLSCFLITSAFYIGGTRHFTSCWSLVLGESAVCCRGVIRSILATLAFLRFMAGNAITLGDLFKATPTMSAGESMKKKWSILLI